MNPMLLSLTASVSENIGAAQPTDIANPWLNFVGSIIASIIATVICVLATGFISKRWRKVYYSIANLILRTGVKYYYHDRTVADEDIRKELCTSKKFKYYGGRGQIIKDPPYSEYIVDSKKNVEILIPVPDSDDFWLQMRAEELKAAHHVQNGVSSTSLATDINAVISHFLDSKIYEEEKLRLFTTWHMGRIIILDKTAYFTVYERNRVGKYSPVYKYSNDMPMYKWLEKYFDDIYKISISAKKYMSVPAAKK